MSGFSDPILTGDGAILRTRGKSPNYVTGVSGWSINRDGTAEFQDITVRGTVTASSLDIDIPWVSFVPTWTGAIANPVYGNATTDCAYLDLGSSASGMVFFRIGIKMGTTTTYGNGRWSFSLPITPAAFQSSSAVMSDVSAGHRWAGAALLTPTSNIFCVAIGPGASVGANALSPFTWAQDDELIISGSYVQA